ncbi:MAG: hypothetical protein ACI9UT_003149 [Flavobacteriales bacterium]|jgi:hypothetical protein
MLTNEQLQEKTFRFTIEIQQHKRFKHLNELILNGLNAILTFDKHEGIFHKLFAVIHTVISCQHIVLHMVDEQEQRFSVFGSTNQQLSISERPLEPFRLIRNSTDNFFNEN